MTEEESLLLGNLKANVRQLFNEVSNFENKISELQLTVEDLKKQIELLQKEKSELSLKNEQLKLATHILSGVDENREAKLKLNKLIREIDKCIALLNK